MFPFDCFPILVFLFFVPFPFSSLLFPCQFDFLLLLLGMLAFGQLFLLPFSPVRRDSFRGFVFFVGRGGIGEIGYAWVRRWVERERELKERGSTSKFDRDTNRSRVRDCQLLILIR